MSCLPLQTEKVIPRDKSLSFNVCASTVGGR